MVDPPKNDFLTGYPGWLNFMLEFFVMEEGFLRG